MLCIDWRRADAQVHSLQYLCTIAASDWRMVLYLMTYNTFPCPPDPLCEESGKAQKPCLDSLVDRGTEKLPQRPDISNIISQELGDTVFKSGIH